MIILWSLASAAKTVVEMKDAQGNSVGKVTIWESGTGAKGTGVGLDLDLHGLPPGRHGIHFHQTAKCDGPDFKSVWCAGYNASLSGVVYTLKGIGAE